MNYFMSTSSPKKAVDLSEFRNTLRMATFAPDPNEKEAPKKSLTHQQYTFVFPDKFKSSINQAVHFVENYYNVKTKNNNIVNLTNAPLFGFSAIAVSDQPSVKNRWTKMTTDQFYQLDEKLKDSVESFQEAHKKIKLDELARNPKFKGNIQRIKNELSKYSRIKKNVSSNLRQEESLQSSVYEVGDLEDLGIGNNSQLDQTEPIKLGNSKIMSDKTLKAPPPKFGARINFVTNSDKQHSPMNLDLKNDKTGSQMSISSQGSQNSPRMLKTTQKPQKEEKYNYREVQKKQASPKPLEKALVSNLIRASEPSSRGSQKDLTEDKIEEPSQLSISQADKSNITASSKQRKSPSPSSRIEDPSEMEKSVSQKSCKSSHKHSYEEEKPSEFKLMFFQPGSRDLKHEDKTLSRNDIKEKSETCTKNNGSDKSIKDDSALHSLKDIPDQSFAHKPVIEESRSKREKSPPGLQQKNSLKNSFELPNYLKSETIELSPRKRSTVKREIDNVPSKGISELPMFTKSINRKEKSPEPVNKSMQDSIFGLKSQLNKIASKEVNLKSEKSEKSQRSSLKDLSLEDISVGKNIQMRTSQRTKSPDLPKRVSQEPISQLKTEMNKIMIRTGEVETKQEKPEKLEKQERQDKKENAKDRTPKPAKEKDFGLFFGSFEQIKSSQSSISKSKQSIDNKSDLSSSLMHKDSAHEKHEKPVLQKKEANRDEKLMEFYSKDRSREEKPNDDRLVREMRGKLQSLSDRMDNIFQDKSKSRERGKIENNDSSEEDYDFLDNDNDREKNLRDFYTNSAYLNYKDSASGKSNRNSDDKEKQMEEFGFFGMGNLKVSSKKLS